MYVVEWLLGDSLWHIHKRFAFKKAKKLKDASAIKKRDAAFLS